MDAKAWSRLKTWEPAIKRLNELGLGPLECAIEVSRSDVRSGAWAGIEPGEYWWTGETREHEFSIGSYSFWETWCQRLRTALPTEAWPEWAPFFTVANRGFDGGWGAGACAQCLELWKRWEQEIFSNLEPEAAAVFERCWGEFRTGFELGAQDGALVLY